MATLARGPFLPSLANLSMRALELGMPQQKRNLDYRNTLGSDSDSGFDSGSDSDDGHRRKLPSLRTELDPLTDAAHLSNVRWLQQIDLCNELSAEMAKLDRLRDEAANNTDAFDRALLLEDGGGSSSGGATDPLDRQQELVNRLAEGIRTLAVQGETVETIEDIKRRCSSANRALRPGPPRISRQSNFFRQGPAPHTQRALF